LTSKATLAPKNGNWRAKFSDPDRVDNPVRAVGLDVAGGKVFFADEGAAGTKCEKADTTQDWMA
jgi:hypothetical protein